MRVFLCLGLFSILLPTASARAESAPIDTGPPRDCRYVGIPHTSPVAGEVPANWPVFFIRIVGTSADLTACRLQRESTGAEVPTTVTSVDGGVEVVPSEPLVVGETYRLFHPACPGESPESTLFVATEPLPEPTSLGTLAASPLHASYDARGRENLRYFVRVTLTLDPSMTPWRDLFLWGLVVNGRPGIEQPLDMLEVDVPIECNPRFPGEPEGVLALGASATHGARTVSAPTIETTTACEDAIFVHIGNLEPLTPDEIAYYDMPGPIAEMDAGIVGDGGGGVDGGRMGMHTEPDTHSTCTCTAAGRGHRSSVAWALALGLAATITLRRRKR